MKKDIQDKCQTITKQIKEVLSEQLGIEPDDLHDDDSFKDDLHMGPAEITDFFENLRNKNLDFPEPDLNEIITITDLTDFLCSKEDI